MSTTIACPHCSAQLTIKDSALLGKKLRCPKCREAFRAAPARASDVAESVDPAVPGFASLDFDESPRADSWLEAEIPTAAAPIWSAPTRVVPIEPKGKPALSKADAARLKSRREYSLLMVGGALCAIVALVLIVLGTLTVINGMRKSAAETVAVKPHHSEDVPAVSGSGTLPTVFEFDETRRALLVDYLVNQGNGKPKAKLTMAMVVNALKALAIDFNLEPTAEFPEELELLRERVAMRDVPEELLTSSKVPAVFKKMISEYQDKQLGPAEEEVAILVIMAFLGAEM